MMHARPCRLLPGAWRRPAHHVAALRLPPLPPSAPAYTTRLAAPPRAGGKSGGDADGDEGDELSDPAKPLRVERLLANLGYGKRQECAALVKRGRVTLAASGKALRVSGRPRSSPGGGAAAVARAPGSAANSACEAMSWPRGEARQRQPTQLANG